MVDYLHVFYQSLGHLVEPELYFLMPCGYSRYLTRLVLGVTTQVIRLKTIITRTNFQFYVWIKEDLGLLAYVSYSVDCINI